MKKIKNIGIIFTILYVIGCAQPNKKINLGDPRSEENLRKRVELFFRYFNERRFDRLLKEFSLPGKKKTKKEVEIEAEKLARESAFALKFEYKIESIKIIGDRGYVFLEETYYNPYENENHRRRLDIWTFTHNNWYSWDVCYLAGNICKEPIIVYNIFVEEITPETFTISWETDEECASEIRIRYYLDPFYLGKIEEWILDPSIKKVHKIKFGRKKRKDESYDIEIWAKKGERECHSPEYHFDIQEILSSKLIPKRLD